MEKESDINTKDGFGFEEKKSTSSSSSSITNDAALISFMNQLQTSSTSTKSNMFSGNINLDRRFLGDSGTGIGLGPIGCTSGGATDVLGNIYTNGGEIFGTRKSATVHNTNLQQPYHNFTCSYPPSTTTTTTHFKSPEGMITGMAASGVVGFPPFTSAQWKELERQAMIYKFFISSVPVPPHLLYSADYTTGRYSKNGDLEPGRCKRTDGKKWRCSRDVAPNQKYCERHLHRGRPRSRKPVEVKKNLIENNKKIKQLLPTQNPVIVTSTTTTTEEPLLPFTHKTDLSISTEPSSFKGTNRDMSCEMDEQHWNHLVDSNMGSSSSMYGSSASIYHNMEQQQPLNLFSYSHFSPQEYEAPTGFIDAWSLNNLKYNSSSNNVNSESSISLNLSMAMGAENDTNDKNKNLRCPISWEPFAGGGPLAEALHSGSSVPASPYNSISCNQPTAVSSPSGVLHKTLFSHSDNSVSNSPTTLASEVAFHWLN